MAPGFAGRGGRGWGAREFLAGRGWVVGSGWDLRVDDELLAGAGAGDRRLGLVPGALSGGGSLRRHSLGRLLGCGLGGLFGLLLDRGRRRFGRDGLLGRFGLCYLGLGYHGLLGGLLGGSLGLA